MSSIGLVNSVQKGQARRNVRRTVAILFAVAFMFYFGFIYMAVQG